MALLGRCILYVFPSLALCRLVVSSRGAKQNGSTRRAKLQGVKWGLHLSGVHVDFAACYVPAFVLASFLFLCSAVPIPMKYP